MKPINDVYPGQLRTISGIFSSKNVLDARRRSLSRHDSQKNMRMYGDKLQEQRNILNATKPSSKIDRMEQPRSPNTSSPNIKKTFSYLQKSQSKIMANRTLHLDQRNRPQQTNKYHQETEEIRRYQAPRQEYQHQETGRQYAKKYYDWNPQEDYRVAQQYQREPYFGGGQREVKKPQSPTNRATPKKDDWVDVGSMGPMFDHSKAETKNCLDSLAHGISMQINQFEQAMTDFSRSFKKQYEIELMKLQDSLHVIIQKAFEDMNDKLLEYFQDEERKVNKYIYITKQELEGIRDEISSMRKSLETPAGWKKVTAQMLASNIEIRAQELLETADQQWRNLQSVYLKFNEDSERQFKNITRSLIMGVRAEKDKQKYVKSPRAYARQTPPSNLSYERFERGYEGRPADRVENKRNYGQPSNHIYRDSPNRIY